MGTQSVKLFPTVAGCTGFSDPCTQELVGKDVAVANGEQVLLSLQDR